MKKLLTIVMMFFATTSAMADNKSTLIDYLLEDEAAIGKNVTVSACELIVSTLDILQCDAKPQIQVNGIVYIYAERLSKEDKIRAATNCKGQLPVPNCKVDITGEIVKDDIGMYFMADTIDWVD